MRKPPKPRRASAETMRVELLDRFVSTSTTFSMTSNGWRRVPKPPYNNPAINRSTKGTMMPITFRAFTRFTFLICLLNVAGTAPTADAQASPADSLRGQATSPIQDNSFLIEEAYNQAAGVVQHILSFHLEDGGPTSSFLFTQEWPVRRVRHQLSYSVPFERADASTGAGLGDVHLNYRYQLVGDGAAAVAVAPRLTVILPTGDYRRARGAGALGAEAWLPVSLVLSTQLVAHANLGITLTPNARDSDGAHATTRDWTAGGSIVWLAHPRLNFLLFAQLQVIQASIGTAVLYQ